MASTPAAPSAPVPERITPMAPLPHCSAADRRKQSMGMCDPGDWVRGASFSAPSASVRSTFAGMTYTWLASSGMPSAASLTGMAVDRVRISVSMLR